MQLTALLATPQHLPTVPTLVQSLIASFQREDVSTELVARQIATDPGMSAKLLRLANSAYFRVPRSIGRVDDALKLLGFTVVRNLVVGCGLVGACKTAPGMDVRQFWRYSLDTACVTRWLAPRAQQDAELGFMVGLLHAIGQFPMRAGMPKEMKQVDARVHLLEADRAQAERDEFGFSYAEAGAELARSWNFPEPIVEAVARASGPFDAPSESQLASVVHVAAWRARAEVFDYPRQRLVKTYPASVASSLKIEKSWIPELAEGAKAAAKDAMPELTELTAGLSEMLNAA
jgi:HD-like signal output (HDOD) protein